MIILSENQIDISVQMSEFASLWARSQPSVVAYVSASVRDYHDAEDIMQEVAKSAAKNFSKFDRDRSFLAWVIGIARHRILKHLRKKRSTKHVFADDTLAKLATAQTEIEVEVDDRGEALHNCISKLPSRGRKIIEMRYLREMKPGKIAEQFGVSCNAISIHLHRVRKALAQCVKQQMDIKGEQI